MRIAVIYGGKSGEHEVSLVSASSIVRNIDTETHQIMLVGIAKNGQWFLQPESELERIRADKTATLSIIESDDTSVAILPGGGCAAGFFTPKGAFHVDVAFLVLHGTYGEDGTIQGLLDMAGVPYTGCGCASSAVSMDKEKTKTVWREAGLPVLPHVCIRRGDCTAENSSEKERLVAQAEKDFGYPLFVKPCGTGSSVGASKAANPEQLRSALSEAFLWDEKVLVEPAINAREIECSVTGNSLDGGEVRAYTPGEIIPSHDFYDYDAKYTDPDGARLCIPADLPQEKLDFIRMVAVRAYKALDCSGLSRVDFFIDREKDSLYLNEINTMPGFTSISMFPKMCEAAGLAYADLIELLLTQAVDRFSARNAIKTSRG